MNPNEKHDRLAKPFLVRYDLGALVITILLLGSFLISIIGIGNPPIRELLMPRFGWIGLVISANILVFLCSWLWKPTRSKLVSAASMSCLIGIINGFQLAQIGTVSTVENVFFDRLHSAWFWSVGLYLAAGIYLALAANRQRDETNASGISERGDQNRTVTP